MIGKAEITNGDPNPRFLVTNLPAAGFAGDADAARFTPARLYENFYCARGEMENVLKQQVLDLEADRLSTHYWASNPLRLWLASFAYLLLERLRTLGCHGTELARATAGSLRLKLLKVAAQVTVSVRRVYIRLSSAYPRAELFRLCHARLMKMPPASPEALGVKNRRGRRRRKGGAWPPVAKNQEFVPRHAIRPRFRQKNHHPRTFSERPRKKRKPTSRMKYTG